MNATRLWILLIMFFPLLTYAQNFSAQVDQTEVGMQDTIGLSLQLEGASAKDSPDLTVLSSDFQIVGQQQGSTTTIVNGKMSSSVSWNLTLVPNRVGTLTIPSVGISTDAGKLSTKPIAIEVKESNGSTSDTNKSSKASLAVHANKKTLYKNERVLVSFELTSDLPLRNIQIGNLNVQDAIVENASEAKVSMNGKNQQALTVSYWITPLKDQPLVIPPLIVRAEAPESAGEGGGNFFDSDDDGSSPFGQMHQQMQRMMKRFGQGTSFGFFSHMRPVVVSSSPLELKVLPAIPGMIPWLPTTSLTLSETWSGDAKVGEPFYRTITTRANGLSSTQLPGFEDQFSSNEEQKIYADQPEKSEENIQGETFGVRKDHFTIVPQKSGELHVPSIHLTWWDTASRTKTTATLPEKIIQVSVGANGITSLNEKKIPESEVEAKPIVSAEAGQLNHRWVWVVISAIIVLMSSVSYCFLNRKKTAIEKNFRKDTTKCGNRRSQGRAASMRYGSKYFSLLAKICPR